MSCVLWCEWTTTYSTIHPLKDMWVVSGLGKLQTHLLGTPTDHFLGESVPETAIMTPGAHRVRTRQPAVRIPLIHAKASEKQRGLGTEMRAAFLNLFLIGG